MKSKLMWFLLFPVYAQTVSYANATKPREGGKPYWWKIMRRVHVDRWGKLNNDEGKN